MPVLAPFETMLHPVLSDSDDLEMGGIQAPAIPANVMNDRPIGGIHNQPMRTQRSFSDPGLRITARVERPRPRPTLILSTNLDAITP
jgi:hypothetical protein